jgi:ribosomal protein L31E
MKWAFIDYENIGSLEKIDLEIYQRIIIFLGAKQSKIDFGNKKYSEALDFTIIHLNATSSNNLDFHLSYYLGKYESIAQKEISFEVISNDNGFSSLISHIKKNGRNCKQLKIADTEILSSKLLDSLLKKSKEKRPKKVETLKNHIASHMGVREDKISIDRYFNQLINQKIIDVDENNVKYLK